MSVALERLDDTETRRLLTYASPGLGDEQARQIIDAAEGNPLFAEHLAALVGDEVAPAGLPRSLQVLLAARLEALPEPEQEVVGVAAVVGRDFAVDAVEAMVGRPIEAELDRLDQRELTERTAPGRARFGHALLQDAAYGLLPKLRRCELHVSLAHWLAERGASDAEVGDHLEHAYRLRADLELLDDETVQLGAEAGAHLAAAGRRADAMGDPRRARFLLDRALALLPERSTERAAALVELAAAGWNLLQREELSRLLSEGADLAAELGARAVELRARLLLLGAMPEDAPDYMDERETILQTNAALAELEAMDAPRAVATALSARGEAEWWLGQAAAGVESVRQAIAVSREADEDSVWAATLVAAMVDSPMPVSDGEQLLGELMADLGIRPTVRSELIQVRRFWPSCGATTPRHGGGSASSRRSSRISAGTGRGASPRTASGCSSEPAGSTRRGPFWPRWSRSTNAAGCSRAPRPCARRWRSSRSGSGASWRRASPPTRSSTGWRPRTRMRRRCAPTWRCRRWASRRLMWTARSAPRVGPSTSPRRATG